MLFQVDFFDWNSITTRLVTKLMSPFSITSAQHQVHNGFRSIMDFFASIYKQLLTNVVQWEMMMSFYALLTFQNRVHCSSVKCASHVNEEQFLRSFGQIINYEFLMCGNRPVNFIHWFSIYFSTNYIDLFQVEKKQTI